jgi:hypothetical protein
MATPFIMASNNNNMDMITQKGTGTPYYQAFKQSSLSDAVAIKSRENPPE